MALAVYYFLVIEERLYSLIGGALAVSGALGLLASVSTGEMVGASGKTAAPPVVIRMIALPVTYLPVCVLAKAGECDSILRMASRS